MDEQNIEKGYHVRLYTNFAKRVNSTKRPSLDAYERRVAFYAKLPFSVDNPTINIRYNSLDISPQWTYAYIDETESYYWVTKIETQRANWWFISLTIDPLATYKDSITEPRHTLNMVLIRMHPAQFSGCRIPGRTSAAIPPSAPKPVIL